MNTKAKVKKTAAEEKEDMKETAASKAAEKKVADKATGTYKGKKVFLGAGFEYKSLQPLTVNAANTLVTKEKVNSSSVFGYAKYSNDKVSIKAYGISGGNLNNLVMLGGYTAITSGTTQTFNPTKTNAFWIDIASNGKSVAPGLFFGSTQNNGADTAASSLANIAGRGLSSTRSIDNVWRLSGRIDFKKNKFRVSPELELTSAKWGDTNLFGKAASNFETVNNFRTMISCVYTF